MQVMFGSGVAWATPLSDATGATITNPTPVQFAGLQEISVEFANSTKPLFAQKQFPIAIGRGTGSINGKAKWAIVNGRELNNLFFGQTLTNSLLANYQDLTGTSALSAGVTVAPPSSGTFSTGLEVRDTNRIPLTRVANTAVPATGQYFVSATSGTFVFSTGNSGSTVYIDYQYTATSVTATKIAIVNQQLGVQPTMQVDLSVLFNAKQTVVSLYNCVAGKLAMISTKLDDFAIPDFDFQAFEGANGIGAIAFAE